MLHLAAIRDGAAAIHQVSMNSIPAQEIERRGMAAVDDLLHAGPVQVIENERPCYVILSAVDYERLTAGPSAWDWLDRPSHATRDQPTIDADLAAERAAWNGTA
jgi:hypothetical protein